MPTGYTAGILDGSIKDFKSFAKLCIRNFCATIHMRDEDLNVEYKKAEPSKYHLEQIAKYKNEITRLKKISDSDLFSDYENGIKEEIKYHNNKIIEIQQYRKTLEEILIEAISFNPPTEGHFGYKKFMIEQLKSTIAHDCDTEYHYCKVNKLKEKLSDVNIDEVRNYLINKAEKDYKYHKEQYRDDIKRCDDRNKWVEQVLETLDITNQ